MAMGLVCAMAAPAMGQTSGVSGRVFAWGDWQAMAARDAFEAVTDASTIGGIGGGLEIHDLWKGVFLRGALSRLEADGERVFVFNGTVFPLGQPLTMTMTPVELGAGWRFRPIARRVTPYLGGGALWLKFREESGGLSSDNVSETYTGGVAFGGVDVSIWRALSAGAEVAVRQAKVKNPGGAFEAFGEDDMGGVSFRLMLSIGR